MATTFNDLPLDIQRTIFGMKYKMEDREQKVREWWENNKNRMLVRYQLQYLAETDCDITSDYEYQTEIESNETNEMWYCMMVLKMRLKYFRLKAEKFEDEDFEERENCYKAAKKAEEEEDESESEEEEEEY